MVPDRMGWESLRLLFAKDLCVMLIVSGNLWVVSGLFWGVQRDSAYEVSVVSDRSRLVYASGKEFCPFRIWASEYDREMSMVDPSTFPIYFGLYRREPWIAKNGLVFAKVGEEELEWDGSGSGLDVQNGVIMEVSTSVLGSVNVEQFAGFWKLFDGEFEPLGVGEIHEVFGCS